jgi:hypothetical protein
MRVIRLEEGTLGQAGAAVRGATLDARGKGERVDFIDNMAAGEASAIIAAGLRKQPALTSRAW